MAAGKIGGLNEFESATEAVTNYVERVEMYFAANDLAEAKQVVTFLSAMGKKTYAVLRDLVSPESPRDKTILELAVVLKQHYEPVPLVIAERFNFHRCCQQHRKSVSEFVADLKRLSLHCSFGAYLDEALRDRLVCGLRSEATQKRLLTEAELTFKKAVEIAQRTKQLLQEQSSCKALGVRVIKNRCATLLDLDQDLLFLLWDSRP